MSDDRVRVAIAGVGNCASSLVQGVSYYTKHPEDERGLMHPEVGGLLASDIDFVAAFDVSESKVGLDLSEAIFARPNNTIRLVDELPYYDVTVMAGPRGDGIGDKYAQMIQVSAASESDNIERVVEHLRATRAEVVASYMPVGSTYATEMYAQAALEAGCGFVNCVPVPLARRLDWAKKFQTAGLPLIGDDIKSQYGATIVHRVLAQCLRDRGYHLEQTYQLNVGGNMDFFNMLQQDRLSDKKKSKSDAVTAVVGHEMAPEDVHIGPSDYVAFLGDHKVAFIRLQGTGFAGAPFNLELRMDVVDSPNSAGIVIDAVRACKVAMLQGLSGVVPAASAWLMKAPPVQMDDDEAMRQFEEFARS